MNLCVLELMGKHGALIATHPRSGTHLTIDLLRRHFPELQSRKRRMEPLDALYVPIDIAIAGANVNVRRARRLIQRHRFPILKSHYLAVDYSNLAAEATDIRHWMIDSVKTIYVVRNPEKVIASFFIFESSFQPNVHPTEAWLHSAANAWVSHVMSWSQQDQNLILRFEDLTRETVPTLNRIADFLDLEPTFIDPLLPPRLVSKWRGRWRRLACTDSPTTEIITGDQQGAAFADLFGNDARKSFWKIVEPVASRFGYVR